VTWLLGLHYNLYRRYVRFPLRLKIAEVAERDREVAERLEKLLHDLL
jgi:hypothetical protein